MFPVWCIDAQSLFNWTLKSCLRSWLKLESLRKPQSHPKLCTAKFALIHQLVQATKCHFGWVVRSPYDLAGLIHSSREVSGEARNHLTFKATASLPPHTCDVHVSYSGKYIYRRAAVHARACACMQSRSPFRQSKKLVNCFQVAVLLLLLLDAIYCSRGRARQKSSKSARTATVL